MYKLYKFGSIRRLEDNAVIPPDELNVDYQAYLQWVSEGNEPLPDDPDPIVPVTTVSMRQARLALLQAGLLSNIETAIGSMPGIEGDAARIEWEYAATLERNHALTLSMAQALQLSEQQIDELFTQAAAIA